MYKMFNPFLKTRLNVEKKRSNCLSHVTTLNTCVSLFHVTKCVTKDLVKKSHKPQQVEKKKPFP